MEDILKELDPVCQQIRQIVIERHLEEPNVDNRSCIYHYTNSDGLLGILRSGAVWTTNAHCLNDPREIDYGLDICREFLGAIVPKRPSHTVVREAAKDVLDDFAHILAPSPYQFIASFSLEGDLLSQWRAYADGGAGFSMGFDANSVLSHLLIDEDDLNFGKAPGYMPAYVIYDEAEQHAMLQSIFDIIVSFVDDLEQVGRLATFEPEQIASVVAYGFTRAALFFKSGFFKEEREMRLLVSNAQEMASAQTTIYAEVRSAPDGRLIRYRSLSLRDTNGLMPINEIIVGPRADFENVRAGLEAALLSFGYGERMPQIRRSAGALRRAAFTR